MDSFAQSWLTLQCKMIAGVSRGIVALGTPDAGRFEPAACWPEDAGNTAELSAAAQLAFTQRRSIVQSQESPGKGASPPHDLVACPLLVGGRLFGVVAVEMSSRPEPQQRAVLQLLQWGATWLEVLQGQQSFAAKDRVIVVLQLLATCLGHRRFQGAATALATDIATRLACERVSIGFVHGRHIRVQALSHSAQFGKQSNLIRAIGAAMDEAQDQCDTVVYPATASSTPQVTQAHAGLSRQHGGGALCTVPLVDGGEIIGAMTLERPAKQSFEPQIVELCGHLASLAGPILEMKRRDDRWVFRKLWDSLASQVSNLLGPRHPGLKVSVALATVLAAFLSVADGEHRVTAPASLEGTVQRLVVAPMDGYVKTAKVRAGDLVHAGDLLCTVDDKDLKLERLKWASQREQLLREYRGALVNDERAQVRILNAQVEQAAAQIALLDEQLARTQLTAPFDGVVITGDLSQSLGAPVERGEVLFEVAPLDSYRIILEVDERDIGQVAEGQQGKLALSGMPGERLPVTLAKITPVSSAREGRNFFRVEARLDEPSQRLRPGMEGVSKITVGSRRLLWIWTHRLVDWVRLWAWSWWP